MQCIVFIVLFKVITCLKVVFLFQSCVVLIVTSTLLKKRPCNFYHLSENKNIKTNLQFQSLQGTAVGENIKLQPI